MKRRKFPRLKEGWDLEYRVVDSGQFQRDPVSSLAVNISGGGVCLEAKEEVEPGTMLAIDLHSPAFDSPILALARAVWCKKKLFSDTYEVGAEFWWVGWKDTDAQSKIADYIETRVPEDEQEG
ncbi:MAG: PilZ domain-containing protein [Candidatus Brocadiia bacterium]